MIEDNKIPTNIVLTILREKNTVIGRRTMNPMTKQRRSVDFLISSNTAITHGLCKKVESPEE
jgi:hypothetical protein